MAVIYSSMGLEQGSAGEGEGVRACDQTAPDRPRDSISVECGFCNGRIIRQARS